MNKMKKSDAVFSNNKFKKVVAFLISMLILTTSITATLFLANSGLSSGSTADAVDPTVTAKSGVYTADLSDSIKNNPNLHTVNTTFYDYYSESEVNNGWGDTSYYESHGEWEPYTTLNAAIANYAKDNDAWEYPLYFGNYYNKQDGYKGATGVSGQNQWGTPITDESKQLYKYDYQPNNSNGIGGNNVSVTGLVDDTLDANGQLTSNGVVMPYFDESFLIDNQVGSVVNTQMPMRVTTTAQGNTLYKYSSDNATDNAWISGVPSDNLVMNYGEGKTNGMKDALNYYSDPKEDSGYGFFPFDSRNAGSSQNEEAENFAFGMRMDTEFTLPEGGVKNGESMQFTYTGDDDVWVYVDGVLVLDLGGDHKEAEGSIDFSTMESTVTTGTYSMETEKTINGTQTFPFPEKFGENGNEAFDNNDPDKVHELTVFYMERGMIESNLEFSFNYQEVSSELDVTKEVDYTDVNEGLTSQAQTVYGNQEFDATVTYGETESAAGDTVAEGKEYVKYDSSSDTYSDEKIGNDGNISFAENDELSFINQFDEGDYIKVVEDNGTIYQTSWTATDTFNNELIASGNDETALFKYEKLSEGLFDKTQVGLVFTNKLLTGDFTLSKNVVNQDNPTVLDDPTKFEFTVKVKLQGEDAFATYPLSYTLTGVNGVETQGTLGTDGKIDISSKETVLFEGLPIGAEVQVTESSTPGYTWDSEINTATITDTVSDIVFTNTTSQTSAVIEAYKYLNGELSTTQYDFELLDSKGTQIATTKNSAIDGKIQFTSTDTDKLNFGVDNVGTNVFYMREIAGTDKNTVYGSEIYKVEIEVSTDAYGAVLIDSTKYYILTEGEMLDGKYTQVPEYPEVKFNNKNIGTLTVNKVNEDNEPLVGAKFKLVEATVNTETGEWSNTQEAYDNAPELEIVDENGQIVFDNLEIGTYLLYETKAPEGYQLLAEAEQVTIDTSELNVEITVSDTGKPDLPVAGSDVTPYMIYIIAGGLVLVAGALFIIFKKRAKKIT